MNEGAADVILKRTFRSRLLATPFLNGTGLSAPVVTTLLWAMIPNLLLTESGSWVVAMVVVSAFSASVLAAISMAAGLVLIGNEMVIRTLGFELARIDLSRTTCIWRMRLVGPKKFGSVLVLHEPHFTYSLLWRKQIHFFATWMSLGIGKLNRELWVSEISKRTKLHDVNLEGVSFIGPFGV